MKLLYIANSRLPTDSAHGVQIVKMCESFAKAGAEVTLVHSWRINRHAGDIFGRYKVEKNFKIVTLPSLDTTILGRFGFWVQTLSFSKVLFIYLLFHRFDVMYSRDEFPLYIASLISRRVFWEPHTGRYNRLVIKLLQRIAGLIVITEGGKDFYVSQGVPKEKIHVAPDAVALEDFARPQSKDESRRRLALPLDKKIALYIGKFDSWKGVETLCAASEYVTHDVVVALIGGEPGENAVLKARYPKCIYLGWRPYDELADNQAAADVLVLPNSAKSEISTRFTSPLKLFTYMASGIPIVSSDLPSIREIVSERDTFFFRPDDAKDLASRIEYVLSHSEEAKEKAREAKQKVQQYTWQERARKILASILEHV